LNTLGSTCPATDADRLSAALASALQDITTDGFGFMLSVGDLVWVPFTYCYSARYVALYPNDLGIAGTAAVLAVQFTGYYIFRGANGEKNEFRSGRNPKSELRQGLDAALTPADWLHWRCRPVVSTD